MPPKNDDVQLSTEDEAEDDDCMRFKLTHEEFEAVKALKEACEAQGIRYKSIFELAKYVLVCHSSVDDKDPKAAENRLALALKRMKQLRKWEAKYDLDSVDAWAALQEMEEAEPGYCVNYFTTDTMGNTVVAHHTAHPPISFIYGSKANEAKYFTAELLRYDLAAPDMFQARKGVAVVSITDGKMSVTKAFRYVRLVAKAHCFFQNMHNHRIRRIYSEVPSFLSHFVGPCKAFLPKKMADRVHVSPSVTELEKCVHQAPRDQVPISAFDWAMQRKHTHEKTIMALERLF